MIELTIGFPLIQGYVGLTLAIPVFLTVLVAVACGLLFLLAATLGISMDSRVGYTLTIAPLVACVVWCSQEALSWLRQRLPLGPVVSLARLAARGLPTEDVGDKARHLALMAARGARVAPGWVLRAAVFDEAVDRTPPSRDAVLALTIPSRALRSLHTILEASGEPRFLLRSSFGGEDGRTRAAPGIHASLVWARADGLDGLRDVVRRVWASYWSDQAVAYRGEAAADRPRLAVLAQPLIDHLCTGVVASADLVGRGRSRHLVDVQTPASPWRGLHDVLTDAVTPLDGSDPAHALADDAVRRLSRLAALAERALGCPAEVEWGLRDGRITLYQARALTGPPLPTTVTNSHLVELPRYPLTPLSHAFLWGAEPPIRCFDRALSHVGLEVLPDDAARVVRSRVMLDVSAFKPLVMGVDEGVSLGAGVLLGALFGRSGRARAPAPPAPPPLDTGRAPADLAGALGALHHEQLVPLVDRQMRALFVAAALDGWLARDGAEMPPRVSRPDEGDGWWRSEREAELAMPRQIERALSTATCAPVDGPVAPRSGGLLARWIAWARDRQLTEREALNAEINAVNHRARQHALALDDGLAEVVPGWVAGDVFYCTPGELISLVAEPTGSPIADERASRRRRHEADEAAVVPTRCELDGAGDPIGPPPGGALGGGVATGVALGEGSVVGPACHARDGADLDIAAARGAILLVAGPSPAWGRHVLVAAGVVLVGSGPLSHLALLARERGVPALTAVSGDLSEIQDGDPLVLDLRAGHLDRAD